MIKARACGGDIAAGEAILSELSPFVWRKYLDFVAVSDVYAMKRQINAYRGHGEIAVEGHNIKLGRGGIREIEFFAQTQQLIAGGRNPALRDRDTLDHARQALRRPLDRRRRARPIEGRLRVPAHGRAPPADGQRRADPDAAGRTRGARAVCALPRLCRPRCFRQNPGRASRQRAAALFAAVREDARRRQAGAAVSRRGRRP